MWRKIRKDLERDGITTELFLQNHALIVQAIEESLLSGDFENHLAGHESSSKEQPADRVRSHGERSTKALEGLGSSNSWGESWAQEVKGQPLILTLGMCLRLQ